MIVAAILAFLIPFFVVPYEPRVEGGEVKENPLSDKSLQLIDEIIEKLPLVKRIEIARMDAGEIWILQRRLAEYFMGLIDDDSEDLADVIMEIWKRLRDTHALRSVKRK